MHKGISALQNMQCNVNTNIVGKAIARPDTGYSEICVTNICDLVET